MLDWYAHTSDVPALFPANQANVHPCRARSRQSQVSPDAEFVELHLANGQYIEWLRYMGWILTCPVLLMTLVSMTTSDGTKPPTVRLVPLLVANLTMVCMGITAASCSEPTKWYIFAIAISFGGFVFSCAIQCFIALIFEAPESNVKCTSIMLTVTFLAGWGCFPVAFVIGHSGLGAVSKNVQWALFVIGDLLSKNAWVGFAALRSHQLDAIADRTATAASAAGLEAGGKGDSKAGGKKEGPSEESRIVKRRCSNSNLILSEINHPNAPTATELSSFKRTGVARTSPYDGAYPVGYGPGAMVHPSQVNPYLYGHGAYHHPHHPPHPHHAYGGAFPAAMAAPHSAAQLPPAQPQAPPAKAPLAESADLAVLKTVLDKFNSLPEGERQSLVPIFAGLLQSPSRGNSGSGAPSEGGRTPAQSPAARMLPSNTTPLGSGEYPAAQSLGEGSAASPGAGAVVRTQQSSWLDREMHPDQPSRSEYAGVHADTPL